MLIAILVLVIITLIEVITMQNFLGKIAKEIEYMKVDIESKLDNIKS